MSNPHRRFSAASFNPAQVNVMTVAFEQAWRDLAGNFDADHVPTARDRLATIIIELASGWPHDVESLTRAGVAATQKHYGLHHPQATRFGQAQIVRS